MPDTAMTVSFITALPDDDNSAGVLARIVTGLQELGERLGVPIAHMTACRGQMILIDPADVTELKALRADAAAPHSEPPFPGPPPPPVDDVLTYMRTTGWVLARRGPVGTAYRLKRAAGRFGPTVVVSRTMQPGDPAYQQLIEALAGYEHGTYGETVAAIRANRIEPANG